MAAEDDGRLAAIFVGHVQVWVHGRYIYIHIYIYIYTYIYIYYTVHHIWIISSTFVSWPHIYILDQTQSKKVTFFGSVAPLSTLGCKELDGEHPGQYPWFTSRRFLGCSAFFAVPGW